MKYKPKPFYRAGFLTGAGAAVGHLFPQPMVERPDGSRARLDDLLGAGFALVAYGPAAQEVLAQVTGQLAGELAEDAFSAALAILPRNWNADGAGPKRADTARDFDGALSAFLSPDTTTCLVLRPDRHVCVSVGQDEIGRFATEVAGLFGEYRQRESSSKQTKTSTGEDGSWVGQVA